MSDRQFTVINTAIPRFPPPPPPPPPTLNKVEVKYKNSLTLRLLKRFWPVTPNTARGGGGGGDRRMHRSCVND